MVAQNDPSKFLNDGIIYNSFSGTDITALILLPNEDRPLILGELQTISYSIHRENTPVRTLGHTNVRGFVRGPRCIPASERVYVQNKGYISIADIKPFDYVQSTNNDFNQVLGSYNQGKKQCVRVKLRNGYAIDASYDHPIYTNRGWVEAFEIQPKKDKVCVAGFTPSPEEDYPICDELLALIALLIGDGSIHQYHKSNGSTEHRIELSINKSEMDTIGILSQRCLEKLNIPFRDYERDQLIQRRISPCVTDFAKTDWNQRRYNSLHKILTEFELYNTYSHSKFVPNNLMAGMSKRQVEFFLSTLFATDGCYAISKDEAYIEAQYCSASEKLIDDIRLLLSKCGVLALKNYEDKVGKVGGKVGIVSRHNSYKLTISESLSILKFIKRIGIYGKQDKIEFLIAKLQRRIRNHKLNITTKDFANKVFVSVSNGYGTKAELKNKGIYNYQKKCGITPRYALKIADYLKDPKFFDFVYSLLDELLNHDEEFVFFDAVSVEPIGELEVYDLEVEDRHQFICEHIVVHNTIAGSMIFYQFNQYAFYRLRQYLSQISNSLYPLADMLPPFDMVLSFSNEYGLFSKQTIFGMTIIDEGGVMSVDDMVTEQTFQYMARGISPLVSYVPSGYERIEAIPERPVTKPSLGFTVNP